MYHLVFFFFSSRRRHTRLVSDWSSDVCSSDLAVTASARAWLQQSATPKYLTAAVTRGRVETVINTTGTVKPRSEERRVGKECRSRWAAELSKEKDKIKKSEDEGRKEKE